MSIEEVLHRKLGELDLGPVVRVPRRCSLREVAVRLRETNVSSALVGDAPRDIVTERDLTHALATGRGPWDPVGPIEKRMAVWAVTTSEVVDAAEMMLLHEVRHLIVLDVSGRAVGVVSMREIFSLLLAEIRAGSSPERS